MDSDLRRKIYLVLGLLAVYAAVSFWVPYSKLWVMKDLMQTQSRMFFASQSEERVRAFLAAKAEDLNLSVRPEDLRVQTINGEIIYIELSWKAPVDILFFHTSLDFNPKIFGLIRGFEGATTGSIESPDSAVSDLSDSTARFLQEHNMLGGSIKGFFSR
ncbi:hypothetical protein LLH00_09885 [bacterium]|nr:hypothetical protein [bacterium]